MSELGRLLYEARTARQLSLADVEAVTRIRQKYLEALETGDYARLPRGTVARGFLRTYAAYLGLDVQGVLDLYTQESGDSNPEIAIAEPGKPRLIDYRPLEVELVDPMAGPRWLPWVAALLVVAALAIAGWWFLNRNPGWNPLAALGPAPSVTPTSTATQWVVTATPRPSLTPTAPLPDPTSDLLPLPTPTVPASPTPTLRPTTTPEVVAALALEVQTSQRAWIRITVDGQVVDEGSFEANTSLVYEADNSITVRTGNGGGVTLILNGEDLGLMGDVGQVIERSWVKDQEGVTETTGQPEVTVTLTPAG
jgi:cytoskeleton protein RodZ